MVGTYNSAVTYYPGDVVTGLDGKNYTVLQEVTGVAPPNATYYELADSLRNIMSTYEKEMQITQAVLDQAETDAPRSGSDTTQFYTLTVDEDKLPVLVSADNSLLDASLETQATDEAGNLLFNTDGTPVYVGSTAATALLSSEVSGYNGYLVGDGVQFEGKDVRQTQKAGFINNTNTDIINGNTVKERQSLSKALRPEADE